MIIYKVTNILNNKIYIGQTIRNLQERIRDHYYKLNNDSYFHNALKKYPKEFWKWEIIHECNTIEELNEKEIYFIKIFNSKDPDIGYNLTDGGLGHLGYKVSDETRIKLSSSLKGKKHILMSEEIKRKISIANKGVNNHFYGKHHSKETREKLSVSHKGKKHNAETCEKIRLGHIGHKVSEENRKKLSELKQKYKYFLINPNKNKYKNIINLKEFCKKYSLNYYGLKAAFIAKQSYYKNWSIFRRLK